MTETEAQMKWCPMVRLGDMNTPTGINRGNRQDNLCMGSACMMWRWTNEWIPAFRNKPEWMKAGAKTEGYCGLAGKP